jgi:hypothetical protein
MRDLWHRSLKTIGAVLILLTAQSLSAQETSDEISLTTFEAGSTASASQVNDNFEALAAANADLKARLEALELFIADLQTYMDVTTDAQDRPAIIISGANLHVNNGVGETESQNGTGNLIVGYDEPALADNNPVCSSGLITSEEDCEAAGESWAIGHKNGSHNLVVGPHHNYSSTSGIVAGENNTINSPRASAIGGSTNVAAGYDSVVIGGYVNTAFGNQSTVTGGSMNNANGYANSISGGIGNTTSNSWSSISGGTGNTASGNRAVVSGGAGNTASGEHSTVGGGNGCEVSATDGWDAGC